MTIIEAVFIQSSAAVERCPDGDRPEFAFVGRSNVGKSSLINMLTNNSHLAKTSSTPGRTSLINHFLINKEWFLVDLPGYGYAKRPKNLRAQTRRMINDYLMRRGQLMNVFLLIDIRHEPQMIDLRFIQWLGENDMPFAIVFTKADKLTVSKRKNNIETYKKKLLDTWEQLPPIFVTSSEKKQGRVELLNYIEEAIKQFNKF